MYLIFIIAPIFLKVYFALSGLEQIFSILHWATPNANDVALSGLLKRFFL